MKLLMFMALLAPRPEGVPPSLKFVRAGSALEVDGWWMDRQDAREILGELVDLRAEVAELRPLTSICTVELASALREASTCNERLALRLVEQPVCPSCSNWQSGLIGVGVGAAVCGGVWLGGEL